MDETFEITNKILSDLCASKDTKLNATYSRYYDSLDASQSREVVSNAIRRIMNENDNTSCEFEEDSFTLSLEV